MKVVSVLLLSLLSCFVSSCGYSAPATTAPTAGVTPAIAQLVPGSATHGAAAFSLTINGSNFATDSIVNWNGTALPTTFMTTNQVVGAVPSSAVATAGTVPVVVTNPGAAGGIYGGGTLPESSNSMDFTIN